MNREPKVFQVLKFRGVPLVASRGSVNKTVAGPVEERGLQDLFMSISLIISFPTEAESSTRL